MNKNWKFMVCLMMVLVGMNLAQAQGPRHHGNSNTTPEDRATKMTERMVKHLGLSETQGNAIYDIHLQGATDMAAIRNGNLDREQQRAQFKALKQQQELAIKQILTPAQAAQLEQGKAQRQEKMGERKKGGKEHGGHGMRGFLKDGTPQEGAQKLADKMTQELGLSDAQSQQVYGISMSHFSRMKAIKDNTNLDHEAKKAQIGEVMKAQKAAVSKVLTPAQLQKAEALKAEWKGKKGDNCAPGCAKSRTSVPEQTPAPSQRSRGN